MFRLRLWLSLIWLASPNVQAVSKDQVENSNGLCTLLK
jgi:hypothetical protein